MITVRDFLKMFTEKSQEVSIFDYNIGEEIAHGQYDDLSDEILDSRIDSIDTLYEKTDYLTLNLTLED